VRRFTNLLLSTPHGIMRRWYNTFCAEVYQTGAGVFEIFRAYKKAGKNGRISL